MSASAERAEALAEAETREMAANAAALRGLECHTENGLRRVCSRGELGDFATYHRKAILAALRSHAERLRQHTGAEADAGEKLDALRRWVAEFAEPALKTLDAVRALKRRGGAECAPFVLASDLDAALSAQAQPTASREPEA